MAKLLSMFCSTALPKEAFLDSLPVTPIQFMRWNLGYILEWDAESSYFNDKLSKCHLKWLLGCLSIYPVKVTLLFLSVVVWIRAQMLHRTMFHIPHFFLKSWACTQMTKKASIDVCEQEMKQQCRYSYVLWRIVFTLLPYNTTMVSIQLIIEINTIFHPIPKFPQVTPLRVHTLDTFQIFCLFALTRTHSLHKLNKMKKLINKRKKIKYKQ